MTDEPELKPSETENIYYSVFRNGELLSTAVLDKLQTHYFDNDAKDGDSYYVMAYYTDGSVSDASEAFIFDSSTDISQYTIDALAYRSILKRRTSILTVSLTKQKSLTQTVSAYHGLQQTPYHLTA